VHTSHAHSFLAYEKARKILEKKKQPVPLELLNNVGALRQKLGMCSHSATTYCQYTSPSIISTYQPYVCLGQLKEAEQAYHQAIAAAGASINDYKVRLIAIL
jgi:hypothetical protein